MKNEELSTTVFDRSLQHRIRLNVRIDAKKCRHDQKVPERKDSLLQRTTATISLNEPIRGEDVPEMFSGTDVSRQTEAKHSEIFTMQDERPIDNVEEQRDVPRCGRLSIHVEEQTGNQFDP